jgi:hypothetical protein
MAEPETREMQIIQGRREAEERERAEEATGAHDATGANEAVTHERRADRAAYLREKLDERARSEEESG